MNTIDILNDVFTETNLQGILFGDDSYIDKLKLQMQSKDFQQQADIIAGAFKKGADSVDELQKLLGKQVENTTSIIRRSRNSILQFPVYISNNIPVTHARVLANLFEHLYLTYAQAVLSQNKVIDAKDANGLQFLKQFHTNLKESVGQFMMNPYYKPIDEIDAMLEECKYNKVEYEDGSFVEFSIHPATDQELIYECKEMLHEPLDGFLYLQEAGAEAGNSNNTNNQGNNQNTNTQNNSQQRNNNQNKNQPTKSGGNKVQEVPEMVANLNDIRKINDLQPTMMIATFKMKPENGDWETVKFIIGVKAVLHMISASDLADEIRDIVMGNQKSLQKVRYKTGEISFLDYMFNMKGLKSDALNTTKTNKRWISNLKRLSEFQKANGSYWKKGISAINNGDVPIPNGTLILTNVDVEYIADQTGIDLDSITYARRLANNLYLIAIGILNGESSFKYFLPDQQNNWDVLSLSSINTTLARLDNTSLQKELGKIINNAGGAGR